MKTPRPVMTDAVAFADREGSRKTTRSSQVACSTCLIVALVTLPLGAGASPTQAAPIRVSSVLVNLLEEVKVPARQEGVLQTVAVQEGQLVEEGEVLARIDDEAARLAVERARLELGIALKKTREDYDLRTAQEQHRVAANNLRRAEQSKEKFDRSISAADLDQYQLQEKTAAIDIERARFKLEVAELTRDLRENELSVAEKVLQRHSVRAPIGGIVVDVKQRCGEWVKPGDPLLRILRIDRFRADGYVSAEAVRVDLTGAPVTLVVDLPGNPGAKFKGTVVFVSPEVNPVDGKVRIWAEIENTQLKLKPGLSGDLAIEPP
jgi:macrolide-specific efflux system membrane fusion protein